MVMNVLWLENGLDIGEWLEWGCPRLVVDDADALVGCVFVNEV